MVLRSNDSTMLEQKFSIDESRYWYGHVYVSHVFVMTTKSARKVLETGVSPIGKVKIA